MLSAVFARLPPRGDLDRVLDGFTPLLTKQMGDELIVVFPAFQAACALAASLADTGGSAGVAAGDVVIEEAAGKPDVFGLPVVAAKRLLDLSGPGEALVPDLLLGCLSYPSEVSAEPIGARTLKGIPKPVETARLLAVEPEPEAATRRLRALVMTDWVASTEALASVGTAGADELRRQHFETLRRALQVRRGEELLNTGDGLVAGFTSMRDAAACASSLQRAFRRPRSGGVLMRIRAALAAGDISEHGAGPPQSGVLTLLAEACGKAASGQTLVSPPVGFFLASDPTYDLTDLGPGRPPALVPSLGGGVLPLPPGLSRGGHRAFVGRAGELASLEEALARAGRRSAALCAVVGEPGVGKSSLLREFAEHAHEAGATVLFGRCDPEAMVPYQPFGEALRELVDIAPADDLAQLVDTSVPEMAALIPRLRARLPEFPEAAGAPDRLRLLGGVTSLLRGLAEDRVLVIVLEDLHWADQGTLLMLRHVLRALHAAPVLLVAAMREPDANSPVVEALTELRRELPVERIVLDGLAPQELFELLHAQPTDQAPTMALATEMAELTSGNPFFVEELMRHLEASGAALTAGSLRDAGIPREVEAVVARRVATAGEAIQRVITTAALLGRSFELELLAEVMGEVADDIADTLDEAVGARLVRETGDGQFRFQHAVTREVLYDSMTATRRARLHGRVADALTARPAADLAEIAYHCARARGPEHLARAVDAGRRSADEALEGLAYEEAARRLELALEAHERLSGDDTERAEILVTLAHAQNLAGEREVACTTAQRAAEAARRANRPQLLASAALWHEGEWLTPGVGDDDTARLLDEAAAAIDTADTALRARVLAAQAVHRANGRMRSEAVPLSAQALELARRAGDRSVIAKALNARQFVLRGGAYSAEHADAVTEMFELSQAMDDPELMALSRHWRVVDLLGAGELDAAAEGVETFGNVALRAKRPLLISLHDKLRAARALWEGRLDEAEELIQVARVSAGAVQRTGGRQQYAYQSMVLRHLQGRHDEAAELAAEAWRLHPKVRAWGFYYGLSQARLGNRGDAEEILVDLCGEDRIELVDDYFYMPSLVPAALLAAELGDPNRSRVCLEALLPFAGTHLVVASGIAYLGPAERYLRAVRAVAG